MISEGSCDTEDNEDAENSASHFKYCHITVVFLVHEIMVPLFIRRGALCLKSQNSSEEELTDTLYSEIDYIV